MQNFYSGNFLTRGKCNNGKVYINGSVKCENHEVIMHGERMVMIDGDMSRIAVINILRYKWGSVIISAHGLIAELVRNMLVVVMRKHVN